MVSQDDLIAEISRLHASRSLEGDRLDWLLCKIPRAVLECLIGEPDDINDRAELRERIDAAAGFSAQTNSRLAVREY